MARSWQRCCVCFVRTTWSRVRGAPHPNLLIKLYSRLWALRHGKALVAIFATRFWGRARPTTRALYLHNIRRRWQIDRQVGVCVLEVVGAAAVKAREAFARASSAALSQDVS